MTTTNEWPDHLSELPENADVIRGWGQLADCPDCEETHTPLLTRQFESEPVRMYFCAECESRVPQNHLKEDPDGGEVSVAK